VQNTRVNADDSYYSHLRMSLLGLIENKPRRVLEIGCGHGQALRYVKQEFGAEFVAGVELVPEVAAIARRYSEIDVVLVGDVEQIQWDFPSGHFDLIIAGHVLEHVKDPWSVARRLGALLKPGGQFVGSLPNVRNIRVSLPLVFVGKLQYTEEGILDWTHTKFFTRSTIYDLLKDSGFTVERIEPEFSKRPRLLNKITLGLFRNLLCFTYNFSARSPRVKFVGSEAIAPNSDGDKVHR
jgi:SAM-dependent methyltransferase